METSRFLALAAAVTGFAQSTITTFAGRIRRIGTDGIITTIAGNGTAGFSGDGGKPDEAKLNNPAGLTIDTAGNLYVAYSRNHRNSGNRAARGLGRSDRGTCIRSICAIATLLPLAVTGSAQDHSTIYVGTNRGLFRTTDGGNTSEMIHSLSFREIFALGAGPEKVLFVAATDGLFRSQDAGDSWVLTNLRAAARPRVILSDPERPDRVYAAGNGLWASSDGGFEWSEVAGFEAPVTDLIINPADSAFLLAATSVGLYRSTDRGVSWQRLPNSPAVQRLVVAAAEPLRLFAGGKEVFLSTDRGDTWLSLPTDVADVSWYAGGLSAWGGLDVEVGMNSVSGLIVDASGGDLKHIAFAGCLTIRPFLYMAGCGSGLLSKTTLLGFSAPTFGWYLQSFMETAALNVDPRTGMAYAGGSTGLIRAVGERSWESVSAFKGVQVHSILVQASRGSAP